MKSMTGYGSAQKAVAGVQIEASLRSVNGRFFDAKVHLPTEYGSFEKELREILSSKLERGSLSLVVVRRRAKKNESLPIKIQVEVARDWVNQAKQLAKKLGIENDLKVSNLLSRPEIWATSEPDAVAPAEKKALLEVVHMAVQKLDEERTREGKKVWKELETRTEELERLRHQIEGLREETNKTLKEKFQKRIEELKVESFDSRRVADEVVWLLEKLDINEELARLKEHLRHFRSLLGQSEGQGKKLDFYTQELVREFNTIGSKSNHIKITQVVIDAKTLVEQIKEQVQNIE